MRRTLLLTTATAVAATVMPALAAPGPADSGRVAETTLVVPLSHGDALQLDLRAAALSGGDVVRIVAQHCNADGSCDSMDVYESQVPSSVFTVDASTAKAGLKLAIAGHSLQLRWQPDAGVGTSGGGDIGFGTDGVSADNYGGDNATVRATVDGRSCTTRGVVGTDFAVDTRRATGSSPDPGLAGLRLPAGSTISCG